MNNHDFTLSSVGAVAMSLLSGVILIAPGTLSAGENTPAEGKTPPAGDIGHTNDAESTEA
jgi:hypothetical protein